jgi:hypothetical protein
MILSHKLGNTMKLAAIVLLALLTVTWVWAQDVTATKVLVPLVVTDHHHRPVSGLTPSSLVITEGKTPVTQVSLMNAGSLPLELGLLIDTSNSEHNGNFQEITAGAKAFVNNVVRGPEDRIFFLTFAIESQATGWLRKDQLAGISINVRLGGVLHSTMPWAWPVKSAWEREIGIVRRAAYWL